MEHESERLARMEAKLDVLIGLDKDKEERIRALEKRDAYVAVFCSAIAIAAPVVVKKVFNL